MLAFELIEDERKHTSRRACRARMRKVREGMARESAQPPRLAAPSQSCAIVCCALA